MIFTRPVENKIVTIKIPITEENKKTVIEVPNSLSTSYRPDPAKYVFEMLKPPLRKRTSIFGNRITKAKIPLFSGPKIRETIIEVANDKNKINTIVEKFDATFLKNKLRSMFIKDDQIFLALGVDMHHPLSDLKCLLSPSKNIAPPNNQVDMYSPRYLLIQFCLFPP